jgi:hypothetical protein
MTHALLLFFFFFYYLLLGLNGCYYATHLRVLNNLILVFFGFVFCFDTCLRYLVFVFANEISLFVFAYQKKKDTKTINYINLFP